jgi:hypothetical protein
MGRRRETKEAYQTGYGLAVCAFPPVALPASFECGGRHPFFDLLGGEI